MVEEISLKNIVGEDLLLRIQDSYLNYLESSAAVYELNGDYAVALFTSNWCDFLNQTSRKLAGDVSEEEALKSGKWICHEDCWAISLKAIRDKKPCAQECSGGIVIYAAPILANGTAIGSNNAGVSNPPTDNEKVKEIAKRYNVDAKELLKLAKEYIPRPEHVLNAAKNHILVASETIAEFFLRKQVEGVLKENEQRLSTTLMSIGDAVIATDAKGIVTLMNPVAEGLTGWEEAEAIGKPLEDVFNIINEQTKDQAENPVARVLQEGVVVGLANHTVLIAKDGARLPIDDSGSPIRDEEGNIIGTVMVFRDITERKRAEQALQESEEKYRNLFENAEVGMYSTKLDGTAVLAVNQKVSEIVGKPKEEILSNPVFINWENPADREEMVRQLMQRSSLLDYEIRLVAQNGEIKTCLLSGKVFSDKSTFEGSLIDITARKRAEEKLKEYSEHLEEIVEERTKELRKSQERFSGLYNSSKDAIGWAGLDGTLLDVNNAFSTLTGYSKEELLAGRKYQDLTPPEYHEREAKLAGNVIRTGEPAEYEKEYIRKDGSRVPVLLTVFVVKGVTGEHIGVAAIIKDITERKRAEEALRESEKGYRTLANELETILDLIPGIIAYKDTENNFIRVNKYLAEAQDMTKEEMKGKNCFDLYPKEQAQKYWDDDLEVINSRKPKLNIEESWESAEGTRWVSTSKIPYVDENGEVVGVLGIALDITERKQAEEALEETQDKLIRAERLAVLGQLAGGVGHELRNPLGAIKNAAYFLNMVLEEPEPEVKETLEILEKEVETSERITNSLLDFARPKPPIRRKVDLNEVVQEALSRVDVPENVKVVSRLDEALPPILVDPGQLDQVFGNIIFNGIQAMPEDGRLTVKSEAPDPKWIAVSFTDKGEGIPDENLEKLFEPLFTTRAKGIGLGLALARTLVEGHGGTIEVESKVGKGSTFTVRLPVSAVPVANSLASLGTNSTEEEGK